eukprot:jgi/Botrbrau1/5212/Bobra.0172s0076.1
MPLLRAWLPAWSPKTIFQPPARGGPRAAKSDPAATSHEVFIRLSKASGRVHLMKAPSACRQSNVNASYTFRRRFQCSEGDCLMTAGIDFVQCVYCQVHPLQSPCSYKTLSSGSGLALLRSPCYLQPSR